jgi:hypothetical protein|tara:strand:- start:41 stop:253 length:213 start_codon:yes stop_codon:yes gene_type:complete
MTDTEKFIIAINTLKAGVEYTYDNDAPITEELFNKIRWKTGEDSAGAIESTTCPHSEITWTKFKEEYDKL